VRLCDVIDGQSEGVRPARMVALQDKVLHKQTSM
jgi:hypothetical protein